MNQQDLTEILSQDEGLKIDFKREYKINRVPPGNTDRQIWTQFANSQWDEMIKDIVALTNGNVGVSDQTAVLIIGADDAIQQDGTRILFDTSHLQLTAQQIMARVNSACNPPIPNIICEQIIMDNKVIHVISIPPTPYLHEITRPLNILRGSFDGLGNLVSTQPGKTYTEYTVFIRKGEDISPASISERHALELDKKYDLIIMNENIKQELIHNLRALLVKNKKGVTNPTYFYRPFKEKHKMEYGKDLNVKGNYIIWLSLAIIYTTGTAKSLSTRFIEQAITSGRYLVYDTTSRGFERGIFLEGLQRLHEAIRKYIKLNDKPEVHDFITKYNAKDRREEFFRVATADVLWVAAMLDRHEDIVQLSSALLSYIMGDKTRLEKVQLNSLSPIHEEAEKIKEEIPSVEDVIAWIIKNK